LIQRFDPTKLNALNKKLVVPEEEKKSNKKEKNIKYVGI
jgi:hypothetical protein